MGHESLIGSPVDLPFVDGNIISGMLGMKILITVDGYHLSGTASLLTPGVTAGFAIKLNMVGAEVWEHSYIFPQQADAGTSITGSAETDGGFILFGNVQTDLKSITETSPSMSISKFFIMQSNKTGDTIPGTTFYTTSNYNDSLKTYSGYYCGTSDIIDGEDGYYYACAFNTLFNTPSQFPFAVYTDDDNSARIFKISDEDSLVDSIRVKFDVQNQVADLVKKNDGGLFIGFNPFRQGNFAFVGERHSFIANVSSGFQLQNVSSIQNQYSDYLGSVYLMPDRHYAIETMIQSLGKEHNKLEVIKTDENGNF
jgi:hypothetical protein